MCIFAVEARESLVDRNSGLRTLISCYAMSRLARALWIEISNKTILAISLTSRLARALWIEIPPLEGGLGGGTVEARESLVDRNMRNMFYISFLPQSRLARALWIEIPHRLTCLHRFFVEARESLVDRNHMSISVRE